MEYNKNKTYIEEDLIEEINKHASYLDIKNIISRNNFNFKKISEKVIDFKHYSDKFILLELENNKKFILYANDYDSIYCSCCSSKTFFPKNLELENLIGKNIEDVNNDNNRMIYPITRDDIEIRGYDKRFKFETVAPYNIITETYLFMVNLTNWSNSNYCGELCVYYYDDR